MEFEIALTSDPIDLARPLPGKLAGRSGSVAEFRGLVRGEESGNTISALEYEAYTPMAERKMLEICTALAAGADCQFVRITHRIGVIPVGEAAIHVVVASKHRAAGFALLAGFMDRLKQDVPIWKIRALDATGNVLPSSS